MILRIGIPRDVIGRGVTVLRCIQRCSSVCRVGAGQPPKFGDLPVDQQDRIDCYLDLLMEWNTRVNLTGWFSPLVAFPLLSIDAIWGHLSLHLDSVFFGTEVKE